MQELYGLFFAFVGYGWAHILLEDIFAPVRRWLLDLPPWLGKPLGLCGVCFTGQLTLWGMLPLVSLSYTSIIMYLGIVCINMIIVELISKHGNKED